MESCLIIKIEDRGKVCDAPILCPSCTKNSLPS
jgi:hypothetical protein